MKERLIMTGAIAGYLIIEAFVFLLYSGVGFNGVEQAVLASTLGLLAALVYGNRPSPAKALTIVFVVIGFFPVWFGPVALVSYFYHLYELPESELANAIALSIVLLAWIVILVVVAKVSRKLHRRRVPCEAEYWLAERAKYRDTPALWQRRKRMHKLSLLLPSALVLLMLFFWAPVTGILARIAHPQGESLGHYNICVPISWTAFYAERHGDEQLLNYWKLRGMPRAAVFWRSKPAAVAVMSFRTLDPVYGAGFYQPWLERNRRDARSLSTRSFLVAGNRVTCWEYIPDKESWKVESWAVDCSSTDLSQKQAIVAWYRGTKTDIPGFYETLSGTVATKR